MRCDGNAGVVPGGRLGGGPGGRPTRTPSRSNVFDAPPAYDSKCWSSSNAICCMQWVRGRRLLSVRIDSTRDAFQYKSSLLEKWRNLYTFGCWIECQLWNTRHAMNRLGFRIEQNLMQKKVGKSLARPITHMRAEHVQILRKLRDQTTVKRTVLAEPTSMT